MAALQLLARSERARTLLAVGLAAALPLVLLLARMVRTRNDTYGCLVWNLFLAAVPFAFGELFAACERRGRMRASIVLAALWLVFFPNAPYLVTDFVHLHSPADERTWFDIGLLASFAFSGGLFAFVSLARVEHTVRARFGGTHAALLVLACAVLSGVGIYLGRFERWNSWDLVTDTFTIVTHAARVFEPRNHPRAAGVTVLYAALIAVPYACLRLLGLGAQGERDARPGP